MSYTTIETAVRARLATHLSPDISEATCVSGDVDALFAVVFETDAQYGIYLDYGGGDEDTTNRPFNHPAWVWTILGFLSVRYNEGIETTMRSIVDRLSTAFVGYQTLNGAAMYVKFSSMGQAEAAQVNDVPFYWVPFTIQAWDRDIH